MPHRSVNRLIAGTLIAALAVGCSQQPAADSSASASASAEPSPSASVALPSESASTAPPSAAASGAGEPSPGVQPPLAVEEWTMTASVDADPGSVIATDVAWQGGLVAIGHVRPDSSVIGDPIPRIWRSQDGVTWTEDEPELGVDAVALIGIAVRGDGQFMIVGQTGSPMGPDQGTAAWVSPDGVDWERIDVPMAGPALAFDRGARGFVVVAGDELWFSPDGSAWEMTAQGVTDVAAGDEGFVAVRGHREEGGGDLLASSDGVNWLESDAFARVMDVAPLGGDWYATGAPGDELEIFVWRSENGLDWSPILNVNDLTPADGPKTGRGLERDSISGAALAAAVGQVFVTLTHNHCCATLPWNHGVWATSDGDTWEAVVEGDAFVAGGAVEQELAVLVGHLRRGEDAAFWLLEQ